MKILSALEIRQADAYTIEHEPVKSIDLMERASIACFNWITKQFDRSHSFKIFCGTGNNGGDGLAIGRRMLQAGMKVEVFVIRFSDKSSEDFKTNEQRLFELNKNRIVNIHNEKDFPPVDKDDIVIDAIFGTGLAKPAEGLVATCIRYINRSLATVISIDIPSGLFADGHSNDGDKIIHARHTLSFQSPKLAFLFAENYPYVGDWAILNINLDKKYIESLSLNCDLIEKEQVKKILKTRSKFSHKGTYGHALLIAGSFGKMGAATLSSKACLRTGAGLLTVHIPKCGYTIIQTSVPEAMVEVDENETIFSSGIRPENYTAVGIGCGIGTEKKTQEAFSNLLAACKVPLLMDADALNILGLDKKLLTKIPENSILTPHPKEFERITENATNDFHRHELQIEFAKKYKAYVVLKGAHTCIACPDGKVFFNNTGNPGMAKGGSGDALTGIILALLTQGHSPEEACTLGVYLHGLAGDIATEKIGMESITASDLIENLGEAFRQIRA